MSFSFFLFFRQRYSMCARRLVLLPRESLNGFQWDSIAKLALKEPDATLVCEIGCRWLGPFAFDGFDASAHNLYVSFLKFWPLSTLLLPCRQLTGEPTPEVQWYRDGSKIDCAKHARYEILAIGSRHTLTINSITDADDEVKFTCEAANSVGKVSTFTRLLVVSDVRVAEADEAFRK